MNNMVLLSRIGQVHLGRVIIQFPHALAPQCGWMREGRRSPWLSMGKPPDKADAALRGQPEAARTGISPREILRLHLSSSAGRSRSQWLRRNQHHSQQQQQQQQRSDHDSLKSRTIAT